MKGWPAHTSYQAELGAPLPEAGFRAEDASLSNLGDLIVPGVLVRTSYNTGPYLIDTVTHHDGSGCYIVPCWSLTGLHADGGEHSRGWLNEYVATWSDGSVRFLHVFLNNDDELFVVGEGFRADRRGQLAMF